MESFYLNYTAAPDILTIAFCILFVILIKVAYINRTKNFIMLKHMMVFLFIASIVDIKYNTGMLKAATTSHALLIFYRSLYIVSLFSILWLYFLYIKTSLNLSVESEKRYLTAGAIGWTAIILYEIIGAITKTGFYIDSDNVVHTGLPTFPIGYVYFVIVLGIMLLRHRKRIYRPVLIGVIGSVLISFIIMITQQRHGQFSYTTASFLFPIYALLYLVHSNPYDLETGTVSEKAFDDLISTSYQNGEHLYLMSLFMHDFEGKGRRYPREIQNTIKKFMDAFFKHPVLFQLSSGHMILVVNKKKDPDYIEGSERMLAEFARVYPIYNIDYKIVFTSDYDSLSAENEYTGFLRFMHEKMEENTVVKVDVPEIEAYNKYKYILSELADIQNKGDLNDPRVLVYAQPVYSIARDRYDTAEALMRLKLPETGMVFPDVFIPIAENNNYITSLTKVILNKTCKAVKAMLDEGYDIRRVSVNFSVEDVKEDDFKKTVTDLIDQNGVPTEKIAIEITESRNEKDFEIIKEKISDLKGSGIKFYLDDFGTGYSNFERIMELPFDIIKFDRSLVGASAGDSKFGAMVKHLASMFDDMKYAVLYEGVEDENDEERCKGMSAKYLQGYKYSKPVPIEELRKFFNKM